LGFGFPAGEARSLTFMSQCNSELHCLQIIQNLIEQVVENVTDIGISSTYSVRFREVPATYKFWAYFCDWSNMFVGVFILILQIEKWYAQ